MDLTAELPRYRWAALAIGWASYIVVFLARLSIGPLAPFLKEDFTLTNAQVGALVSAAAMLHVPTLIIGGWLCDRFGVRKMMAVGTSIVGLCSLALFFATSYEFMYVAMLASGLGTGCIPPSALKALMQWFPPKERATAIGINQTAVNFGDIIGAAILPTVAIIFGWRYGYLLICVAAVIISIGSVLLYRRPPNEAASTARSAGNPRGVSMASAMVQLVKKRDLWMLGLAGLFFAIVEFATTSQLVLYLKENLLFSAVAAGGLLALAEASGALGKPVSGLISDRLLKGNRKIVFIVMDVVAAAACLLLGLVGRNLGWMLYPTLALLGGMVIGWGGIYATINGELAGKELVGVAYGTGTAIMVLGVIVGPPLFGWVVDITHSYEKAWLAMAISAVISILFALQIREPKRQA